MTLLRLKKKSPEIELRKIVPEISKIEYHTEKLDESNIYRTSLEVEVPSIKTYEVITKGRTQSESLVLAEKLMKEVLLSIQESEKRITK